MDRGRACLNKDSIGERRCGNWGGLRRRAIPPRHECQGLPRKWMKKQLRSAVVGTVMVGMLAGTALNGKVKNLDKLAGKSADPRAFAEMSCKGKQSCKGKKKSKK